MSGTGPTIFLAVQTDAADVLFFWLAMAAELKSLLDLGEDDTGMDECLASKIRAIFNARYREFIEDSPGDIYFVTFYLHPHKSWSSYDLNVSSFKLRVYGKSDVLKSSSPGTVPSATVTIPAQLPTNHPEADQTPNPKAYKRAKVALIPILQQESTFYKNNPLISPLSQVMSEAGTEKVLGAEFKSQLVAFARHEYPFSDRLGNKTPLQWWQDLLEHPKAYVLAKEAKAKQTKSKPSVTFMDTDSILNPAKDTAVSDDYTDPVKLIDVLSSDDEELESESTHHWKEFGDIDVQVDQDVNIRSNLLKGVVPKEMKTGTRAPPVIIAGMLALDATGQSSGANGVSSGGDECDWSQL
ncbi:hypothetical protein PQX77_015759 [Marasmius sp. AFHP31]|nr:hypothetical protein PQX77_015759 [Marasmius sp. AFHP31]